MIASAANRVSGILAGNVRPYLRSRSRKPLSVQLRELAEIRRAYRCVPYHYFKYELYAREAEGDFLDYLPPRILYDYMWSINPKEGVRLIQSKVRFRRALAEAGLPVVTELFHVDEAGVILDADLRRVEAGQAQAILRDHGRDVFVKPVQGTHGRGAFIAAPDALPRDLFARWRGIMVQPVVAQHPALAAVYPHAINTVRIDSLRTETGIVHNAAVLRMGAGGAVIDNGAAGGLFAGVDLEAGRVRPLARRMPKYGAAHHEHHPDTGVVFGAVIVPFWEEIRRVVACAAEVLPLGSLGWDVAVTPDGPVLLEANYQWGPNVMQMGWGGLARTEIGRRARRYWGLPEPEAAPHGLPSQS